MSALLDKIVGILNDQRHSIEDSENIILQLESFLDKQANAGKCSFNLDIPKDHPLPVPKSSDVNKNRGETTKKDSNKTDLNKNDGDTIKEKIFRCLAERMKKALHSKDEVVRESNLANDLIRQLVDSYSRYPERSSGGNDAAILNFVRSSEREIFQFIESQCRNHIIACLSERIRFQTTQDNIVSTSVVNIPQKIKVTERIEKEIYHNVVPTELERASDSKVSIISCIQGSQTAGQEVHRILKPDLLDNFQRFLKEMNVEQQSLYTDILIDHLCGMQNVVERFSKDPRKINNMIDHLKSKILMDQPTFDGSSMSFNKSGLMSDVSGRKTNLSLELENQLERMKDLMARDMDSGEGLQRSLDGALFELVMDISGGRSRRSMTPRRSVQSGRSIPSERKVSYKPSVTALKPRGH